jgi:hypothetical protein
MLSNLLLSNLKAGYLLVRYCLQHLLRPRT